MAGSGSGLVGPTQCLTQVTALMVAVALTSCVAWARRWLAESSVARDRLGGSAPRRPGLCSRNGHSGALPSTPQHRTGSGPKAQRQRGTKGLCWVWTTQGLLQCMGRGQPRDLCGDWDSGLGSRKVTT